MNDWWAEQIEGGCIFEHRFSQECISTFNENLSTARQTGALDWSWNLLPKENLSLLSLSKRDGTNLTPKAWNDLAWCWSQSKEKTSTYCLYDLAKQKDHHTWVSTCLFTCIAGCAHAPTHAPPNLCTWALGIRWGTFDKGVPAWQQASTSEIPAVCNSCMICSCMAQVH